MNNKLILLFSFVLIVSVFAQLNSAAYVLDLKVTRVSHYDALSSGLDASGSPYNYYKLCPGYTVTVSNGGNGASQNTTMNFYIRTFDNKTLVKYIKVPAMNPGDTKRISFSCNSGSDGSFKEGYVLINPAKSFNEVSYKNNLRHFTLQDVILKNSTKTVTETYYTVSQSSPVSCFDVFDVNSYNSVLTNHTGVNAIQVKLHNPDYFMNPLTFKLNIPASLQNQITITLMKAGRVYYQGHPNVIVNDSCLELDLEVWETTSYITDVNIDIAGSNLENAGAYRDSLSIWDRWGNEINLNSLNRHVTENYTSYMSVKNYFNATYNITDLNYTVHHQNVTSLRVLGDCRGLYVARWFITAQGNFNSISGIYGSNFSPALIVNSKTSRFGISHRMRDIAHWF